MNTTSWNGPERRNQPDRRTYSLTSMKHQLLAPQRMAGRRKADRTFPLLDRFEPSLLTFAMLLMVCSILDSIFTLTLIAHGGTEVNPFMNWALHQSVWLFAGLKMLLTGVAAIVLVATGNVKFFGLIRARSILAIAVGFYFGLLIYEIGLLSLIY
ncbi:MAG: hypothetical protein KTR35_08725 [Gammaproteobacteria bacterium]|nr:hypothetical protein [Gammaproteobacteria bacterium]